MHNLFVKISLKTVSWWILAISTLTTFSQRHRMHQFHLWRHILWENFNLRGDNFVVSFNGRDFDTSFTLKYAKYLNKIWKMYDIFCFSQGSLGQVDMYFLIVLKWRNWCVRLVTCLEYPVDIEVKINQSQHLPNIRDNLWRMARYLQVLCHSS